MQILHSKPCVADPPSNTHTHIFLLVDNHAPQNCPQNLLFRHCHRPKFPFMGLKEVIFLPSSSICNKHLNTWENVGDCTGQHISSEPSKSTRRVVLLFRVIFSFPFVSFTLVFFLPSFEVTPPNPPSPPPPQPPPPPQIAFLLFPLLVFPYLLASSCTTRLPAL